MAILVELAVILEEVVVILIQNTEAMEALVCLEEDDQVHRS